MDDGLAERSARAAGVRAWDAVEPMAGGKGGLTHVWADGRAHVVKAYDVARGDHGARERAALGALAGAGGAPALVAEADDPPFVVMEHVDGTRTLADVLLGSDDRAATTSLLAWAEALAHLHDAGTEARRTDFAARLCRGGGGRSASRVLASDFTTAADRYAALLRPLGLSGHGEALEQLRVLPARLGGEQDEVLSPADACPDNAIVTADGVRLVDFEHAELRHPAWDVAYLLAPWPSCWCAWRLPGEVAAAAVDRYVTTTARSAVAGDLRGQVDLATLGWQVMISALFLEGALASDDADVAPGRPTRRAFVLHRLAEAGEADGETALSTLARRLHDRLRDEWGDVGLALAPAFRGGASEG